MIEAIEGKASTMGNRELENINIGMIRPHLRDIPDLPLPDGYSMRLYRKGEGPLWTEIVRRAEPFLEIDDDRFDKEFGAHLDKLPDRCHFLLDPGGRAVGTTTAWFLDDYAGDGETYGLIHWVAIRPESQGRGLCKPMLTIVLTRLAHEYDKAALNTSSGRIPALKCYLDLGFVPYMSRERAVEGWSQVRSVLKHPVLEAMPELGA
ncbi:MAG: GNAT family N-acetyltransferase [Phycisphaerae bacterium]|nr:GNAT family N-acetyltransferase [Phycisphaerae bacterium]